MGFWKDVRLALRAMAGSPGFHLLAAVSLALGVGANTAIFSLVDGLWFRPIGATGNGEVGRVFSTTARTSEDGFSWPEFADLASRTRTMRGLVAWGGRGTMLVEDGRVELQTVNVVSPNFFEVMGVRALHGRVFRPDDDQVNPEGPGVLLGHAFWQKRFGGDPAIVGHTIRIMRGDGVPVTVLGILPPEFREMDAGRDRDIWMTPALWTRQAGQRDLTAREFRWFNVAGRLAPSATIESATSEFQAIEYRAQRAGANGLGLAGIAILLVMLCALNVANLLLARSAGRSRELAIRQAIGSSRGRLIRQLITENLLLGIYGILLGIAFGSWLIQDSSGRSREPSRLSLAESLPT